jgi:hypothetical protein
MRFYLLHIRIAITLLFFPQSNTLLTVVAVISGVVLGGSLLIYATVKVSLLLFEFLLQTPK